MRRLTCESCGAYLDVDGKSEIIKCPYCGAVYTLDELGLGRDNHGQDPNGLKLEDLAGLDLDGELPEIIRDRLNASIKVEKVQIQITTEHHEKAPSQASFVMSLVVLAVIVGSAVGIPLYYAACSTVPSRSERTAAQKSEPHQDAQAPSSPTSAVPLPFPSDNEP